MMIYAINKRSKEHRHVNRFLEIDHEWRYVQADADGWIPWGGGECPLPEASECDVRHRDGEEFTGCIAYREDWKDYGSRGDIIAYRPILDAESEPEAPAWDGDGLPPVGVECEVAMVCDRWQVCEVVAETKRNLVLRLPEDCNREVLCSKENRFRPLRSAEDKAVEAIESALGHSVTREGKARDIYNAILGGEVPGVKLEGE